MNNPSFKVRMIWFIQIKYIFIFPACVWGHCILVVSDTLVFTDSSTGVTPCWHQAITSTSPNLLLLIKLSLTLWHENALADILQTAFQMHIREKKNLHFN